MTYDLDKNGEVIVGEFYAIFGESEMAPNLFGDLDDDSMYIFYFHYFTSQRQRELRAKYCLFTGL